MCPMQHVRCNYWTKILKLAFGWYATDTVVNLVNAVTQSVKYTNDPTKMFKSTVLLQLETGQVSYINMSGQTGSKNAVKTLDLSFTGAWWKWKHSEVGTEDEKCLFFEAQYRTCLCISNTAATTQLTHYMCLKLKIKLRHRILRHRR